MTARLWIVAALTFDVVTALLFHKYVGWDWLL